MYTKWFVLLVFVTQDCFTQEDDNGPYRGKFIGKLNSYHHQVSGDVYAVDDWTIMLVEFNYDGTGDDTFFWAGDSGRPGPLGFIVPDQFGTTNILERYNNAEIRIKLPDGKRVSRLTWLAIYDLASQNAFGDVYVPEDFESPSPRTLTPLVATPGFNISSKPVKFTDASTIVIPEFFFDGNTEEAYFWTGVGPQPSSRGFKIPDEDGYLEPLSSYSGSTVTLKLPGGRTAFEVNWLSIWDERGKKSLATVLVPDDLNLPPAPARLHPYRPELPHCRQLHRDVQVQWEVFGNQVTVVLAAQIGEDEYVSFGVSGEDGAVKMEGADVAVASWDERTGRALATDYNITAVAPCVQVLGRWTGVCRDDLLGGQDSHQVISGQRTDGLTVVRYRRGLEPPEEMDRPWPLDRLLWAVWAAGPLDHAREPAHHRLWPRAPLPLRLARDSPDSDCVPFTIGERETPAPWEPAALFDPALRVFRFTVGAAGGARGPAGRTPPRVPPALAWYVNGQLAPDLQLRRGLQYTFKVSGGDDPHSARLYHPLVVTDEPHGGLERLTDEQQGKVRVLAGGRHTRRGRLSPTTAGPLCLGELVSGDARRNRHESFRSFNRSLSWRCPSTAPAELLLSPNSSWPDIVYYNSFTHADMGGRIFVVDRPRRARSAAHTHALQGLGLGLALSLALTLPLAWRVMQATS